MFSKILQSQKAFFASQETKSISYRISLLQVLKREIISKEQDIIVAIYKDFGKPAFETYITEISVVLSEIDLFIKKIKTWSKPKRIKPALLNFPSSEFIYKDPYGAVLIISPWNYPFQLAIAPLIAAISCGNTVVLKPSELTPNTSSLLNTIISKVFKPEHALVIEGNAEVASNLLKLNWDYIFFTGSVNVGKIVAKAAAEHLTPVTLELGGKNPCIIDETANLKLTAKRLVWGKFLNAGQTCIAPDYILIKENIKQEFYNLIKNEIITTYGTNPENSEDFTRIVNEKNFERLKGFLENETIVCGGKTNPVTNYIAPTLLDESKLSSNVMKGEIFGPILPVISYSSFENISETINNYEKPLALYVFSNNLKFKTNILNSFSFGGGVINDTIIQFTNHRLPFGGVGNSGIGAYHGEHSFNTFTHQKSIVKKGNWLDLPFRYAPYKNKLNNVKKLLKWL
ncbi:aldehyde dehydrogenase [Aurantibacter sp.]|uniref:aldehyde dehydrogenase n=1 Tax=Aurantibacter sp. TaxID=2807103 RepID=UPI0035C7BC7D